MGKTVEQLAHACNELVAMGYGDKIVLISDDDEGNGFHAIGYDFTTDPNEVKALSTLFHDGDNPDNVVLLG